MKAIFGLVRVTRGRVLLDGKNITNTQPETLVKLGMAYVPQNNNVFPTRSVLVNLEMGPTGKKLREQDDRNFFPASDANSK